MSSYTAITEDGKYLVHYGVKGMKWGKRKRRYDRTVGASTTSRPSNTPSITTSTSNSPATKVWMRSVYENPASRTYQDTVPAFTSIANYTKKGTYGTSRSETTRRTGGNIDAAITKRLTGKQTGGNSNTSKKSKSSNTKQYSTKDARTAKANTSSKSSSTSNDEKKKKAKRTKPKSQTHTRSR